MDEVEDKDHCYYCQEPKSDAEYTIDCDDKDMEAPVCEECLIKQLKARVGGEVTVRYDEKKKEERK